MSPEQFVELAERSEQATGPDRELDASIFKALGAPVPFQFLNKLVALTFDEAEQCYFAPIGDMRVRYEPPTYTASLDAAMTLIEPEVFFHVSRFSPECDGRGEAHVYPNRGLGDDYEAEAATPALALCAAALRARAGQQP